MVDAGIIQHPGEWTCDVHLDPMFQKVRLNKIKGISNQYQGCRCLVVVDTHFHLIHVGKTYFTMIVDIAREVLIVVDQIMVARSCLLAFLGVVIALWLISGDLRVLFDKWSKRFQLEVNVPKSRQFRAWSHLRILI